jgi:hypothetical protein
MSIGTPEEPFEQAVTELEAERMRAADADAEDMQGETPAEDEFDAATGAVFGKP